MVGLSLCEPTFHISHSPGRVATNVRVTQIVLSSSLHSLRRIGSAQECIFPKFECQQVVRKASERIGALSSIPEIRKACQTCMSPGRPRLGLFKQTPGCREVFHKSRKGRSSAPSGTLQAFYNEYQCDDRKAWGVKLYWNR